MKKILITCWAMEIGGVERSLLGLLNAIDYSQYEVELFLCRHEGEFFPMLPKEVKVLPEIKQYTLFQKPIKEVFRSKYIKIGLKRVLCKLRVNGKGLMAKETRDSLLTYYCKASLSSLPMLSQEVYDLAISFLTPHYFTRTKVAAKKYVAWIHTDYTALNIDKGLELTMWQGYDYIAAVSSQCLEAFKKVFPELTSKLIQIENILSPQFVRKQTLEDVSSEMPDETGITKICSVGRFSTAKAFDNAVKICKVLLENGCQVKWYVVGYGGDEGIIRDLINQYELEQNFIILGKKVNPYPYINACDIYIQPSRYEGKAVAVREAQILGKLPIITNFETAPSQLEDGVDGIIVPMDINECAKHIQAIIENENLREAIVNNILNRDYGNENEVTKIYDLMGNEELQQNVTPLRVLHCVGKMNCGGAETMLMNIYRHIDEQEIRFDFLVHSEGRGAYDEEIIGRGGNIYYIPSQGSQGIISYIKTLKELLIKQGPFDVVHSHMDWQGGIIALTARLAGIKKVIVHSHTSKLMNQHFIYKILLRLQKLCIAACATDYWACSKEAQHFLFYKYLSKKSKKNIIPNAINLEQYIGLDRKKMREELGVADDTFLMGHVGSLSAIKNQLFLIDLAKELKNEGFKFKLLLVGEGQETYRQQLIGAIKDKELHEQVELLGQRNDIPSIMDALDLFLMPSLFEGLGIAVIEAQAAGSPCIVSKNVPKEVDMGLGLVKWLSIESVEAWVKEIQGKRLVEKINQNLCQEAITKKGYNILDSTRKIKGIYLAK